MVYSSGVDINDLGMIPTWSEKKNSRCSKPPSATLESKAVISAFFFALFHDSLSLFWRFQTCLVSSIPQKYDPNDTRLYCISLPAVSNIKLHPTDWRTLVHLSICFPYVWLVQHFPPQMPTCKSLVRMGRFFHFWRVHSLASWAVFKIPVVFCFFSSGGVLPDIQ